MLKSAALADEEISSVYKNAETLSINEFVLGYMAEKSILSEKSVSLAQNIGYMISEPVCDSVYIYSSKSNYVLSFREFGGNYFEKFADNLWKELADEPMPVYRELKYGKKSYKYLSVITPVFESKKNIGYIVHNINANELSKKIKAFFDGKCTFVITDESGYGLFSDNKDFMYTNLFSALNGEKISLKEKNEIKLPSGDCYRVKRLEKSGYYLLINDLSGAKDQKGTGILFFAFIPFAVLVSCALAFVIAVNLYGQIQKILSLFGASDKNGIHEDGFNEILFIKKNVMDIISKNQFVSEQLTKRVEQLRSTQAMVVQTQMNSHFIMNSLQLVNMMILAEAKKETDASFVIKRLSELLRSSMDTTKQLVRLEEEIDFTKKYTDILNIRYENSIKVVWDINEKLCQKKVVKMFLQPLVENAVFHGLLPSKKEKLISISAYESGGFVYVLIEDNGVGMTKEEECAINAVLSAPLDISETAVRKKDKFGLENTNRGIKLVFGDECGCRIKSEKDAGTKIIVKMKCV